MAFDEWIAWLFGVNWLLCDLVPVGIWFLWVFGELVTWLFGSRRHLVNWLLGYLVPVGIWCVGYLVVWDVLVKGSIF